jgi:Zn-finger protein
MPPIDLTFHQSAGDESMRELCSRYWALGDDGRFTTTVTRLAADFGIPKHEVASTVALYCTAFSEDQQCVTCGIPRSFVSRADYEQHKRPWSGIVWTCEGCLAAKREEAERAKQADIASKRERLAHDLESRQADGVWPSNS